MKGPWLVTAPTMLGRSWTRWTIMIIMDDEYYDNYGLVWYYDNYNLDEVPNDFVDELWSVVINGDEYYSTRVVTVPLFEKHGWNQIDAAEAAKLLRILLISCRRLPMLTAHRKFQAHGALKVHSGLPMPLFLGVFLGPRTAVIISQQFSFTGGIEMKWAMNQ